MMNNNLFYRITKNKVNLTKMPLETQKACNRQKLFDIKSPYFKTSNVRMGIDMGKLIFFVDQDVYKLTDVSYIYYIVIWHNKKSSFVYKIFDHNIDDAIEIEVKKRDDADFRRTFRTCFIFTDLPDHYVTEKTQIGRKTLSNTYLYEAKAHCQFSCNLFLGETYDKYDFQENNLIPSLYQSIVNIKDYNYFNHNFVNFYESEREFVIVFENTCHIMMDDFMKKFMQQKSKSLLFKSIFNDFIDLIGKIDLSGHTSPFINPHNMIIVLNRNPKVDQTTRKSTLKKIIEIELTNSTSSKVFSRLIQQISRIMAFYSNKNLMEKEQYSEFDLVEDVKSLIKIRFLNSSLVFKKKTPLESKIISTCFFGEYSLYLFSNYILYFTSNINSMLVGIFIIYLLGSTMHFWEFDSLKLKIKNSIFISFSFENMKKWHSKERDFMITCLQSVSMETLAKEFEVLMQGYHIFKKPVIQKSISSYELLTSVTEINDHKTINAQPRKESIQLNQFESLADEITINQNSIKKTIPKNNDKEVQNYQVVINPSIQSIIKSGNSQTENIPQISKNKIFLDSFHDQNQPLVSELISIIPVAFQVDLLKTTSFQNNEIKKDGEARRDSIQIKKFKSLAKRIILNEKNNSDEVTNKEKNVAINNSIVNNQRIQSITETSNSKPHVISKNESVNRELDYHNKENESKVSELVLDISTSPLFKFLKTKPFQKDDKIEYFIKEKQKRL